MYPGLRAPGGVEVAALVVQHKLVEGKSESVWLQVGEGVG